MNDHCYLKSVSVLMEWPILHILGASLESLSLKKRANEVNQVSNRETPKMWDPHGHEKLGNIKETLCFPAQEEKKHTHL